MSFPQIPASASKGETGKINAGRTAIPIKSKRPFEIRDPEKEPQSFETYLIPSSPDCPLR